MSTLNHDPFSEERNPKLFKNKLNYKLFRFIHNCRFLNQSNLVVSSEYYLTVRSKSLDFFHMIFM